MPTPNQQQDECNKCGHARDVHSVRVGGEATGCERCVCTGFVPPGDADAYIGPQRVAPKSVRAVEAESKQAIAELLAACADSGDERIQAALAAYRRYTREDR